MTDVACEDIGGASGPLGEAAGVRTSLPKDAVLVNFSHMHYFVWQKNTVSELWSLHRSLNVQWCLQSRDTDWCQAGQVDLYWCCVERSSQDFADQAPPDPITLDTPLFHPQPHHLLFRPHQRHHHHHHHHHHSHHHQHHADGADKRNNYKRMDNWTECECDANKSWMPKRSKLYKGESLSGENQTDQLYLYLTKTHPCLTISFDREIKFQKGNFLNDIPNCAEVFLGKQGGCLLRSFVEAGKYFTFPLIAPLLS